MDAFLGLIRQLERLVSDLKDEHLYRTAVSVLGTDASPADQAPDELGCAETVNEIYRKAFGELVGGNLSTYRMYQALQGDCRFKKLTAPKRGCIIISPTGYGGSATITNGHVGIMGEGEVVMSNSSYSGKFEKNYTLATWRQRYAEQGNFPVVFFGHA